MVSAMPDVRDSNSSEAMCRGWPDADLPRPVALHPPRWRRLSFRRGMVILVALLTLAPLHATDSTDEEAKDVTALFNTNCGGCHGKDGRARTPMAKKLKVRDLSKSKIPDAEIERQIRQGRQGAKGETLMPAFDGRLSDQEIKELIAKVKQLRA